MTQDRITELRVQGFRPLADVRLPLGGLTVLIGENGSGKSSLVEAMELLCKAARPGNFVNDQLGPLHGGLGAVLRAGASEVRLSVRIEAEAGDPRPIEYSFALAAERSATMIVAETLDVWASPEANEAVHVIERDRSRCHIFDPAEKKSIPLSLPAGQLALTSFGSVAQPAIARVLDVLGRGRVHVPFDVRPAWVSAEQRAPSPLREAVTVQETRGLERFGANLANCYFALKQVSDPTAWERTLERVRAGLGLDVVTLTTPPAGRGLIELAVQFRGMPSPVPASSLSEGQLAYLAFVALAELAGERTFLAFDEPELHLHPELLVRVVWLLEEIAKTCPVVVSTHSDRLLDALSDPAAAVVLCKLDDHRATHLRSPDPAALAEWMEQYRGLGDIRSQGYARHVLTKPVGDRS